MTLNDEFKNVGYRRAYAESLANTIIATQLRLMRGDMTQAAFAEKVGLKQSRISAMEDENYSAWSTKTLKRLASANDVVFLGRFVSFGELLDWSRRLSEDELRVYPFADDPAFRKSPTFKPIQLDIFSASNLLFFPSSSKVDTGDALINAANEQGTPPPFSAAPSTTDDAFAMVKHG